MAQKVILYVENDPDDVAITEASFKRLNVNYSVHAIVQSRGVIDRMKNAGRFTDKVLHPVPEIIILDVFMPEIGGFALLTQLRAEPDFQHIPIFLLTDYHNSKFRDKATRLGATGYLQKSSGLAGFARSLDYMNTMLMAAFRYDLLIDYEHESGPSNKIRLPDYS